MKDMKKESVKQICEEFQINRNVPAKLYKTATKEGSNASNKRARRPSFLTTNKKQSLLIKYIRKNRKVSCRSLRNMLKISHITANKVKKLLKFKKVKSVNRPVLTNYQKNRPYDFALLNKNKEKLRRAYLDEKWFECFREKKDSYKRKEIPLIFTHSPSRRFHPRVMFIAVTSLSAPGGKVAMWPVIKQKEFERNSKHDKKGETLLRIFRAMVIFFAIYWINQFYLCVNN